MRSVFLWAFCGYLGVLLGVSLWARTRIRGEADYWVAGRRLPLSLAFATLLATWFGAGTLVSATDEVRLRGLSVTGMEPFGAGACLILAGVFFARPLWERRLLTVSDLYRQAFGRKVELASVWLMVPGNLGWIAAQLVATAGILNWFLDVPLSTGVVLVAFVATIYTLLGGMWSVTLTDAIQLGLVGVGLVWLSVSVFGSFSDDGVFAGMTTVYAQTDSAFRQWIPSKNWGALFGWIQLFAFAALGNLPGQDLAQRIFSSKSATVAQRACVLAGVAYLAMGIFPVFLGLAGNLLLPETVTQAVLAALATQFLSPVASVLFSLCLLSVILSTIDSAILAAASLIAQNGLRPWVSPSVPSLRLCRYGVVGVAVVSLLLALTGARAYTLMESAYSIPFFGLFVPFCLAVYGRRVGERAVLGMMALGIVLWVGRALY